jgi:CRISPR-associated endonuclease/helicase Cas3
MPIFAKTNPPETLEEHTENCLNVLRSIRESFPDIPSLCGEPSFFQDLFYAVVLHDIGKAAQGFQEKWEHWGYRHEILSAGFVTFINGPSQLQQRGIALAIISHHRSISEIRTRFATSLPVGSEQFIKRREELEPQIDFIRAWLANVPILAQKYLGHGVPMPDCNVAVDKVADAYRLAVQWYITSWEDDERTPLHSTYGIFLRGFLIACDHLASGGKEEIKAGLSGIAAQLGIRHFRPFQRKAETIFGSAFLSAPTGSGKTEAALLWAGHNQDGGRRIFYVLPYTASINAMTKRLSARFGEDNVGVLHGKARYFVYKMFLDRHYSRETAAQAASDTIHLTRKIYRPLKILTPFQILKAFFGVKGWETMMSEMAGGLFIFDEIHVYDAHTTALILTCIENLSRIGARFLFLSATFPRFLRDKIAAILPGILEYTLDESLEEDRKLLYTPRHKVVLLDGEIVEHLDKIRSCLTAGKRVLVVCNTVKRAQEIYCALRDFTESSALLHGRFVLKDREAIERKLESVQLLVGTQAVEVSLDLDFDTIFSEPAPIDAIIQRLGRVNRKGTKGIAQVNICRVGSEKDKFFYDVDRVNRTISALVDGEELTQVRVAELLETVYQNGYNDLEQGEFDQARTAFDQVIKSLKPFDESESDEDFEDLIKSVEVVPQCFENAYRKCLDDRQFFEATRYFATISLVQEMKLLRQNGLDFRKHVTEYGRTFSYPVVFARYDNKLGLLVNEIENKGVIID